MSTTHSQTDNGATAITPPVPPEHVPDLAPAISDSYPDWWNENVKAYRTNAKTYASVKGELESSITQFYAALEKFNVQAKFYISTIFLMLAAAGPVAFQGLERMFAIEPVPDGLMRLAAASVIFLGAAMWGLCSLGLLNANYGIYVASVIESTKKHMAFDLAHHAWHEYVIEELKRKPKDKDTLITMYGKAWTSTYLRFRVFFTSLSILSLLASVWCLGMVYSRWKGWM